MSIADCIIDLSFGLDRETPVFPGDPPPEITIFDSTEREAPAGQRSMNSSRMVVSLHCGTHMDAPFHFFGEGHPIDRVPLEQCVGPAVLIRLPHHGAGTQITKEDLMGYCDALCETRKVVLNTGWYRRWGDHAFFVEHPVIAGEAAEFLVECGVHLVGVDMPSVDRYPFDAHVALLGHGAVIVENLTNLDAIGGERFYLVALPLKIIGRDGSPVRAIAMGV